MTRKIDIPQATLDQQFASSNPENSAWVAANAGSGKTHVLAQRVIRLLLAGSAPDRILCLTFTKAAAANMKGRIFKTLGEWAMLEDDALRIAIRNFTGEDAGRSTLVNARSLFAKALEAPGGLKIQTIHAFCEGLLHQFPLEANVPGHFETLQDSTKAALLKQARADVLSGKAGGVDLVNHYRMVNQHASPGTIEAALGEIIAKRSRFLAWTEVGIAEAMLPLYEQAEIDPGETEEGFLSNLIAALPLDLIALAEMRDLARTSEKSTDQKLAEQISTFVSSKEPFEKYRELCKIGLNTKGEIRKTTTYPTKIVKDKMPEAPQLIVECGEAALFLQERLNTHRLLSVSFHLFHLGRAVLTRYEAMKRALGAVDFDDQIERAANLLCRADMREWIRYRLDQGIDHLLVDEAQDTSPRQWEIINAVTADFHSGANAARTNRTIFVVGDEKQSIYSFQGAEPAEFARQQKRLAETVRRASKPYHPGRLNLSFRSTPDVLLAVDKVFEDEENRRGLEQSGEKPTHDAVRRNDPGEVLVWPAFVPEKSEPEKDWLAPVNQQKQTDPAVQLAERITASIGEWVGKPLPGSTDPLKFSDILVLVRNRDRFITALTRKMKDAGLAVAGADRITLTEHIAVEDLLALGRFALLPQDDLTLASVLKSAFFNLSEDQLFELAHDRPGNLLDALYAQAGDTSHPGQEKAGRIVSQLDLVCEQANQLDVFEFYAWALGPLGGRKAFLTRLGTEAEDVLDAFLEETLAFLREGNIGLENFIGNLERTKPEIKREVELDRDEVRILTVHASKGLEAKVVFLIDPCSPAWSEKHRPKILDFSDGGTEGYLWMPTKKFSTRRSDEVVERLKAAAQEEYRRLLYVGMTRAADRLVLCAYQGKNEPKEPHWHQMVTRALEGDAERMFDESGAVETLVWRSSTTSTGPGSDYHRQATDGPSIAEAPVALPDWLLEPARREPPLPHPLSPSGAHALIADEVEEPLLQTGGYTRETTVEDASGQNARQAHALERGNAIHKLLQTLPDHEKEKRQELAHTWLSRNHAHWSENQKAGAWRDVERILDAPELKRFFELPSRAEVAVAGKIETRSGTRMIAGQIDRLIVTQDAVTIIDFKTSRHLPDSFSDIPGVYVTQLALYREIARQVYPRHDIDCNIIWTFGPRITTIPGLLLDEAIVNIRNS